MTISDRYAGYLLAFSEAGIQPDPEFACMEMTQVARKLPSGDPSSLSSVVSRFHQCGVTAIISEHDGVACQVL